MLPLPAVPRVRRRTAVVAVALVGLLCAACGGTSTAQSASDTLKVVAAAPPTTLDPCWNSQSPTALVERQNVVEGLTSRNPVSGEVLPLLATSWTQSAPDTWTFTLRDGVTFTDGTPFTADAVAFTIKRTFDTPALDCQVPGQFFPNTTPTAKVVDAHTVAITTAQPDPILPQRMAFLGIVPTSTGTTAKVNNPVGTGPFTLATWNQGVDLTLDRNDSYWGPKPDFAKVNIVWRADASVRSAMIRSGEVDIATDLDSSQNTQYGITYDTNQIPFLRLDPTTAPMNDIRVRQAINYAIDKQGILQSVFNGNGKIASQIVPPGATGFNDKLNPWPFDLAKAKDLIAQARAAGTPVDLPITLIGRNGLYPNAQLAMQVVQNSLAQAGLNVKVQMLDTNAWFEYQLRPFSKASGAYILQTSHGNQGGDASFTMQNNYSSTGRISNYGTPQLDGLIAQAGAASGAARQADFAAALAEVDAQARQVVLVQIGAMIGVGPHVTYKPNASTADQIVFTEVKRA